MFRRKIYDELLRWKERFKGKEALLIEGAHCVGKSTIAEELGKNEYRSYVIIDFSDCSKAITDAFQDHIRNLDELFTIISYEYGIRLYERESLIVFDEIQMFPKARQAIKKLVADGRFDYIETGSLISIKENVESIVIPSEETSIRMYPMDFEEFCWSLDEPNICDYIRECFNAMKPVNDSFHKKLMFLFKQYILVGGMPQSVLEYVESTRSFMAADQRKRSIIDLYRKDIRKIRKAYGTKVAAVFEQIPGFLSMHEKRVSFSNIDKGLTTQDSYDNTFFWLEDSMITNICSRCNDPNVGFAMSGTMMDIKCYMGDTGLLFSHAFSENTIIKEELYKQIMHDKLSINKSMLYENVIAQMLVANNHKLYFYTRYNEEKHRNDIEIDFLISKTDVTNSKIIPIEVKSSKNYSTISLDKFRSLYAERISECYVIHPKNLKIVDGIRYIPCYMTICL